MSTRPVSIIGTGIIGQSWAISFARAGLEARLYDHIPGAAEGALSAIADTLARLAARNLLPGQSPEAIVGRIRCAPSLADALRDAIHVQESTPESLELKRRIFAELDAATPQDAVIASSTSALLPSGFTAGLAGAARCLVAHPLNPPHLIPAVEIVPSPATSPAAIEATHALLASIGQKPVIVRREVEGFLMNRLQGALLDEAFLLVSRGYASIEDIDTAMRDGLARRWSIMGPFETIDLNAPGGVAGFIERYGPAYAEIGRERPGRAAWSGELAKSVIEARRSVLPAEDLPDRSAWRDARLASLAAHFLDHDNEET